jgi:hypothetical protein
MKIHYFWIDFCVTNPKSTTKEFFDAKLPIMNFFFVNYIYNPKSISK